MQVLRLTLHRRWFDEIASGTKTTEYREIKPYWISRLEGRRFDAVEFRNGYGPTAPRMLVECLGIELRETYEIKLGRILERPEAARKAGKGGAMQEYIVRDDAWETYSITAETTENAIDEMIDWMGGACFDTADGTVWYTARMYAVDDEGNEKCLQEHEETIAFHPDAPPCTASEHDWLRPIEVVGGIAENPGVWGHGGGVIITEVCRHCGRYKKTDTWAQNMATGEQGLESISYADADEASLSWISGDDD